LVHKKNILLTNGQQNYSEDMIRLFFILTQNKDGIKNLNRLIDLINVTAGL